jgi:hypothetical protein
LKQLGAFCTREGKGGFRDGSEEESSEEEAGQEGGEEEEITTALRRVNSAIVDLPSNLRMAVSVVFSQARKPPFSIGFSRKLLTTLYVGRYSLSHTTKGIPG